MLSSRAGSLPEVVGDAGLFFDPTDVASMAATINQALADTRLRDDLACRALDRAGLFTWDRSALALIDHFEDFEQSEGMGGRGEARRVCSAFKHIVRRSRDWA